MKPLDQLCVNTIRLIAADAVQQANSGHPGMPMGAAPLAHLLWSGHMHYNPANPSWHARDRFVLSAGHGSLLLYTMLHLTGFDLSLDEIKRFRQLHSRTPGHPEYGEVPGVEMTTGPLGQGFGAGIGLAIAQKYLAARYQLHGKPVLDYKIYGIVSDGDLMEGVASEAASLAGHLGLGNIVYLYDDNGISIEGSTSLSFTEDRIKRFESYGWMVRVIEDGNDLDAIDRAIIDGRDETSKPTLICVRTVIGYGSPNKAGLAASHGAPLGEEELALTKKNLGWDPGKKFHIPDEVLSFYRSASSRGKKQEEAWHKLFTEFEKERPEEAKELKDILKVSLPPGWEKSLPVFTKENGSIATRIASEKVLNAISPVIPGLLGGSADLADSNMTYVKGAADFQRETYAGKNLRFGVREHAMGAALNGMALTPGIIPYGGTFLVFSDYMRPAIRLAALMKIAPIYVFTHDSIGLGEDGPTHQPIEQLAALRAIPGLTVIRPADAAETVIAWKTALEQRNGPTALVLTRQKLPFIDRTRFASAEGLAKGAYVMAESLKIPKLAIIASGSEIHIALEAYERLAGNGVAVRLVNMASWELFERQSREYKESILPSSLKKRIGIEAGSSMGWERYVGDAGVFIGMTHFGLSAPAEVLFKHFGFTADNIINKAEELL